jgi:hypothetical protein
MRIICKECHIELSKDLAELPGKNHLDESDGNDFLPLGRFYISDGSYFTDSENKIIINTKDFINEKNHPIADRLNGCCGLDGMDGINKVCANGHEIGTAKTDCWMPHCIILEPQLVDIE